MERLRKLAAPQRGRIERGKPGVVVRVLDLVYRHQAETGDDRVSYRRLRVLARFHDPAILERGRIHWGLYFLVRQGHVERLCQGEYRIIQ